MEPSPESKRFLSPEMNNVPRLPYNQYRESDSSLHPLDLRGQNHVEKAWNPEVGANPDQRLPLTLSKSFLSPPSPDIRFGIPSAQVPSVSSHTSTSSSVKSTPSSSTSLSLPLYAASGRSGSYPYSNGRYVHAPGGLPQHVFRNLPTAIYICILRQLKSIHDSPASQSCQTCYLRDLCALSLTSRAWDKVVVKWMYERIPLTGSESRDQIKKHKTKIGTRLRLLRRTLRNRIFLARLVRELKVPNLYADGDVIPQQMIDLVASVVMACPNLEKFDGLYPIYSHEYDRLTHALSTRRRLKQHIWLIGHNDAIEQRQLHQLAPGIMDRQQKASFVQYHNLWSSLTTLILYSPEDGVLEKDVFVNLRDTTGDLRRVQGPGILHRLPSLRHLCIANFDMDDFDDRALQLLPPLHSLRLQELEGVTFWGLSEFARTRAAFAIRHLSLVQLDVTYLSAISNLMLHLKNLKRFTLVQDTSPEVAAGEVVVVQPVIAAKQLEYIHWEIAVLGSANRNLASSIRAGGFPRLRRIRAPADHDGALQALCRPRACIELPSDWSGKHLLRTGVLRGGLREARRAAQRRIEDAWSTVLYKVVVEGEDGVVHEIYDLNGFMGTVGSQIHYCLDPDVPGSDRALVDFGDLLGGKEEFVANAAAAKAAAKASAAGAGSRHGGGGNNAAASASSLDTSTTTTTTNNTDQASCCSGAWNATHPRGPKWWRHIERPRYAPVDWSKFF